MAYDSLQIGLEHHRAGRLQRAAAIYRSILEKDPGNPDAMHWTGVLNYQAGQPREAIFWLEQAAAIRGTDAAYQHNLARAYLAAGERIRAITAFEKAVEIDPGHGESWEGLGIAYLTGGGADETRAAVAALEQARLAGQDSAPFHHQFGVALLNLGMIEHAVTCFERAIEKDPKFAPAQHHLALARRASGDPVEARRLLQELTTQQPDYAPAWHGLAVVVGEAGHWDMAESHLRKAIALRPDYAAAYNGLAHVLEQTGRKQEAMELFRRSLLVARDQRMKKPADVGGSATSAIAALERRLGQEGTNADLHYALTTVTGLFAPARVPEWAVADLFNEYASFFDQHLREGLQYRVPDLIAQAVAAAAWNPPEKKLDILDLGCGTGLCGMLLKPLANSMVGVDLAQEMINKSRERSVYDRLVVGEMVRELEKHKGAFDLLVAADVMVYVGDLAPTFEAGRAALRNGGRFVFSVESLDGDRYQMRRSSRRYSHAKPYLQHLARICGFIEESIEEVALRLERDRPIPGYLVVLCVG